MGSQQYLALFVVVIAIAFLPGCGDSTGPDQTNQSDQEVPSDSYSHKQRVGNSANDLLSDSDFNEVVIEIDYMPAHKPTQDGLNSLKTFMEKRLHKQTITFNTPTEIPAGTQTSYTAADIRDLEEEHRDNFTDASGSTLHLYFLVVDAEFDQSNVLGIAYWNTSVAFFGPTIENISGTPPLAPSEEKIESTVFRHELGHLMGLVDNGSPMQTEDHKTTGSAHCTTNGCLMEPSVRTTDFFSNFSGNIPPLDDLCTNDLQANGGK